LKIALDASYSLGQNLSGVGVYSREILFGLAAQRPDTKFLFSYRPHRFLASFQDSLPANASRRILFGAPRADLFHALNQRVDARAKRTVATFHDLFVMTSDYSSPEFRARFTAQARQAADQSDLLIAVSQFTAGQMETLLNVKPERIRVIPHGVHIPVESTTKRENIVLFVGAIQRRKNVARLVRAFETMPEGWRLVLAGSQGWGAEEELRAVESSPRRQAIDVPGYVSTAELNSLYDRARIFAFASLDEGFGMPVLEAMARGIAVVTSRRSALPEVAGDAALLVDPENVEELSEALRNLASNEDARDELAQRGRARAGEFRWESAVERTWAVYQELNNT
jgi:glycosyltransferase involved in cell wall biosynthesis